MMSENKLKISDEFSDAKISDEDASQTLIAREIVQEILKFGVSQLTLKKIIEILALELEDRSVMLSVVGAVRGEKTSSASPIYSQ